MPQAEWLARSCADWLALAPILAIAACSLAHMPAMADADRLAGERVGLEGGEEQGHVGHVLDRTSQRERTPLVEESHGSLLLIARPQWKAPAEFGFDLPAPAPELAVADRTFDDDIETALATLPPDFRAAVVLCDVEGLSYEEIAEIMDAKLGTVRSRIHRGRTMLRKALAHREPAAGRSRYSGPVAPHPRGPVS